MANDVSGANCASKGLLVNSNTDNLVYPKGQHKPEILSYQFQCAVIQSVDCVIEICLLFPTYERKYTDEQLE